MGAEVARILAASSRLIEAQRRYGETLYRSSEALREPCTVRSAVYCASGLAAFLAAQVVNVVSNRSWSPDLTIDFRNALVSCRKVGMPHGST